MVVTENELRELWRNGRHPLPAFPLGTRFTPAAQDFLKDHNLTVRFAEPAAPSAPPAPTPAAPDPALPPAYLAARLDSLHVLALLAAAEARQYNLSALAALLWPLAVDVASLRAALAEGRVDKQPALPAATPPDGSPAPAFPPVAASDHAMLHWLNLLRATAREVEALAAGQAPALAPHLHRLGHTIAELAAGFRAGRLGWQPG
ncbi:MAG: hypothetical protein IT317_22705 [Anaerolineales bacterium]|nr:hypothetical protein [Anaerolineales bacterium]